MKKLIFRKFIKDTNTFFLIILTSIVLIVWVIQAVNFLDFVTEDGHGFKIYFLYTTLHIPKILGRVLILTYFISLFYILLKYEENNELLIFWTNGIKKIEFTNNIIRYSLIFLIIQLFLNIYIIPKSSDLARSFIRTSNIDLFPALIKEKKFIDTVSNLTIFVDKKNNEGELENIFLKDQLGAKKSQIIFAKKGIISKFEGNNLLTLYNGNIIKDDNKKITTFYFDKFNFNLSKFDTKSTTHPKFQELTSTLLTTCWAKLTLDKNITVTSENIECTKRSLSNIQQELFKRIGLPLYLPIIALIACYLILKTKDSYNYSRFKFLLFNFGILIIIVAEVSVRYVGKDNVSNLIILMLPIFIFLITYLFLIKKLGFKR